mmetsp:Transcript_1178/g.2037  ORF Transcript_1178/g.2037 Transcript_1178/m.2037 type:complete len:202 (+) Transcript_1178:479-1084(+)
MNKLLPFDVAKKMPCGRCTDHQGNSNTSAKTTLAVWDKWRGVPTTRCGRCRNAIANWCACTRARASTWHSCPTTCCRAAWHLVRPARCTSAPIASRTINVRPKCGCMTSRRASFRCVALSAARSSSSWRCRSTVVCFSPTRHTRPFTRCSTSRSLTKKLNSSTTDHRAKSIWLPEQNMLVELKQRISLDTDRGARKCCMVA